MIKTKRLFTIILFLFLSSRCYADGLRSLAAVGKSQKAAEKVLAKETKAFEAVKNGLATGDIKEGQTQEEILKKYGEPVIAMPEENYTEKWIYKPGHATYFDNIKIYLFFDKDKKLIEVKA